MDSNDGVEEGLDSLDVLVAFIIYLLYLLSMFFTCYDIEVFFIKMI